MRTRHHIARLLLVLTSAAALATGGGRAAAQPLADVAAPFRDYYNQHQGMRVLGYPVMDLVEAGGWTAQYFEKGRIEDHRAAVVDPAWAFMYGRLTAELIERDAGGSVNSTATTYADLARLGDPRLRHAPLASFRGGTTPVHDGMFVPYDPQLRPAPGYDVAPYFWAYINRAELFPGGWLHDIGLPLSDTFTTTTVKQGAQRTIFMQAFERSVLTYDMRNPAGWQVERGNIGADALRTLTTFGGVEVPAAGARVTLPLHMLVRGGQPGERVSARLRWQDGTTLANNYTLLRGEDGRGLLLDNLNWLNEGGPPAFPRTQPATLEVVSASGDLLARQTVIALGANDQDTQLVKVYWVLGDDLQAMTQRVPRTSRIGTAALEALLGGLRRRIWPASRPRCRRRRRCWATPAARRAGGRVSRCGS